MTKELEEKVLKSVVTIEFRRGETLIGTTTTTFENFLNATKEVVSQRNATAAAKVTSGVTAPPEEPSEDDDDTFPKRRHALKIRRSPGYHSIEKRRLTVKAREEEEARQAEEAAKRRHEEATQHMQPAERLLFEQILQTYTRENLEQNRRGHGRSRGRRLTR